AKFITAPAVPSDINLKTLASQNSMSEQLAQSELIYANQIFGQYQPFIQNIKEELIHKMPVQNPGTVRIGNCEYYLNGTGAGEHPVLVRKCAGDSAFQIVLDLRVISKVADLQLEALAISPGQTKAALVLGGKKMPEQMGFVCTINPSGGLSDTGCVQD